MAQSVGRPTSAQVMISQFMGSSPASGSVLTAQSLEPASDSVSGSLCSSSAHSPSLKVINFFFNVYLFLRERQSVSRGGAEREGDTESEAGSRL